MLNVLVSLSLIVCFCGGIYKVWDVDDGQCLHTITDHCGTVKVCVPGALKYNRGCSRLLLLCMGAEIHGC